jgi:hypothetical protein
MVKQAYEYSVSLAAIALVLTGVGGISFHAFREDGWVGFVLGNILSLEMQYPLVAIPLTVAAILLFRAWRNHRLALGRVSRVPAAAVYVLMGAGAYFIARLALDGTF